MGVQRTQVLVVGGGLVGLTTALALRHHGIEVTLVEKRASTSPQPKARRLHMRSMEIFREFGLAGVVREAARDLAGHDRMAEGRTLAESAWLPAWQPGGPDGPEVEVSPELPCLVAQDVLEPVLRRAAVDAGADVRFGCALVAFDQDDDGVRARVSDTDRELRAGFLVAADGASSLVRTALGVTRSGHGAIGGPSVNVYFRADLGAVVRGREANLCQITHPEAPGALASVDGRTRWVFMAPGSDTVRDWPRLLRLALGVPAPDLEVLSVLAWQAEMLVADRLSVGRAHLVGDAAHVMPPFAAAGANTGISDAHALAWKLAAVLRGEAAPALLDTHDEERRPAAWFVADQSSRRTRSLRERVTTPDPDLAHPYALAVGVPQYRTGAIVPEPGAEPEPVTTFAPAGRVGTRVPHRWLDAEHRRSTLDVAGPGWAVLTTGPTAGTTPAGLPVVRVDDDVLGGRGAALLRPDHVVAWRLPPACE